MSFAILGALTLDVVFSRWHHPDAAGRLSPGTVLAVDAGCLLATLVTPYHVRLYGALHEVAAQTGVYWFNAEMRAMPFRDLADWIVLGLTLAAAFVLDARHPRFLMLLFLMGIFVSVAAPVTAAQGGRVAKKAAREATKDATGDAAKDATKGAVKKAMAPDAVDLNTASTEQLTKLGLDEATQKKLVAGRPYASLDDAKLKEAVPAEALKKLEGKVMVKPAAK